MKISYVTKITAVVTLIMCGGAPIATADPGASQGERSGVWERLAKCESGGNWAANTGNGYSGGLQFSPSTWRAYGGSKFANQPHNATREEQIAVATKIRNAQGGYRAWPQCARKLGLNR